MDNKWDMLESSNEDREKIWTKNRTFAGDVWFRFRHKPTSIAGFVIILLLILFAAFGPLFTKIQLFGAGFGGCEHSSPDEGL